MGPGQPHGIMAPDPAHLRSEKRRLSSAASLIACQPYYNTSLETRHAFFNSAM